MKTFEQVKFEAIKENGRSRRGRKMKGATEGDRCGCGGQCGVARALDT